MYSLFTLSARKADFNVIQKVLTSNVSSCCTYDDTTGVN